ncbi:MAG: glutaredoxin family protein [Pseudomonadales bacterium]
MKLISSTFYTPFRILGLFVALSLPPGSFANATTAPTDIAANQTKLITVYVRNDCPHCADAKVFLASLVRDDPTVRVIYKTVDQDQVARDELIEVSRRAGTWPPGVPTFVHGTEVLVGFDDADHIGLQLRALIDNSTRSRGSVETEAFGTLSASRLGLPLFTLAMGLLDGFNPCAMWILLFLLSLLARLKDRRRMALVAGTFVLTSGVVYYAFLAAWLNVFLFVGMSDQLRIGLAIVALAIGVINVKDFFAWGRGPSLTIPEDAKPGLYSHVRRVLNAQALPASLFAVAVLAVAVNFVELLCTAGLPAIYTAVLTQQQLGGTAYYAYLGLYILGYLIDDSVMVAVAVFALGSNRLSERSGRYLKLLSGAVMLVLALVMLLRPDWLS